MPKVPPEKLETNHDIEAALRTARKNNIRFWSFGVIWIAVMLFVTMGFGNSIGKFDDTRAELDKLQESSKAKFADLSANLSSFKQQLDTLRAKAKSTEEAAQRVEAALVQSRAQLKKLDDNLIILRDDMGEQRQRIEQLETEATDRGEPLTAEEIDSIVVEQSAVRAPRKGSKKDWWKLIYRVSVKNQSNAKEKRILASIERVTYNFDKRWFNPSSRSRTSSEDGFRLSITVWGTTPVTVEIHLRGRIRPVFRKPKYMQRSSGDPLTTECSGNDPKFQCLAL